MTPNIPRFVAAVLVCLASACGAPGAYDVCVAQCNGIERCGYRNDDETAACVGSCDQEKPVYDQQDTGLGLMCKNAGSIRNQQVSCYNDTPCGTSATDYTNAAMKCVNNAMEPQNCIKP